MEAIDRPIYTRFFFLYFLLIFLPKVASSSQWQITPSLSLQEIFTDNINLDSSGEEAALVTMINPGIYISNRGKRTSSTGGFGTGGFGTGGFGGGGFGGGGFGTGGFGTGGFGQIGASRARERGRLQMDLIYRMQHIISTQSERTYDIRHQLRGYASAELIRKSFFVDMNAGIGQTLANPFGRQTGDNITNSGNRSNFYTYGISPYWRPYLGGYAEGEARFGYNYVSTSGGQSLDSHILTESVTLKSGHRFSVLTWQGSFYNSETKRTSGQDVKFQTGFGEIRYRWHRKFSTFVQAGYNNSSFSSQTNNNQNGIFYTFGGTWKPSRQLRLEGGWGRNSFASLTLEPSRRTFLQIIYRHNKIGTNTGNVYQGIFQHRTRRTVWRAQYIESTTTTQAVLAQQQSFGLIDAFGNPILDPVNGQPVTVSIDLPRLVDEVFIRKRGQFSFTGNTAKTTLNLTIYASKRNFQVTKNDSRIIGINGNWTWRFGRRTFSNVYLQWQKSKFEGRGPQALKRTNYYWLSSFRLIRRLTPDFSAFIEYRRQQQKSTDNDQEYTENRGLVGLTMIF